MALSNNILNNFLAIGKWSTTAEDNISGEMFTLAFFKQIYDNWKADPNNQENIDAIGLFSLGIAIAGLGVSDTSGLPDDADKRGWMGTSSTGSGKHLDILRTAMRVPAIVLPTTPKKPRLKIGSYFVIGFGLRFVPKKCRTSLLAIGSDIIGSHRILKRLQPLGVMLRSANIWELFAGLPISRKPGEASLPPIDTGDTDTSPIVPPGPPEETTSDTSTGEVTASEGRQH